MTSMQHADADLIGQITEYRAIFPEFCPGADLQLSAEKATGIHDLIWRLVPESRTGCIHGPDSPCPWIDEPELVARQRAEVSS